MDISQFAASLLPRAEYLLREWYPAGKLRGSEFVLGNLQGEEGESLSINVKTGLWADFSTGDKGGDLVALYAAREGIKQGEAAKALGWSNGAGHGTGGVSVAAPVQAAPEAPQRPPADAVLPSGTVYEYRDRDGALLFCIQRTEATDTDRKSFRPYTYRNGKWHAKAWPAPRPLFGLEQLSDKRVLLVEGEKACLAARQLLPSYCSMTWAGGAAAVKTADWSPLYGRDVDLWPDADMPGNACMAIIAGLLMPHIGNGKLRVLKQDGQPDGWDLADALADGWDTARVVEHVKRDGGTHIQAIGGQPLQVGKPHDGRQPVESQDAPGARQSVHVLRETLALVCGNHGPYCTESNVIAVMNQHEDFKGRLWLNEFAQELMFDTVPFDKAQAIQMLVWFQQKLEMHKLPLVVVERAAMIVGNMNIRHPVKQWLNGLVWDGVPRLAELMTDGFGVPSNEYSQAVGRCWLIAMVARIYQPGCQADNMPVFEGRQGMYKSSAMRILGGQWFMEAHVDPIHERKEFLQGLQGHWLIEIPEMHTIAGRGNGIEKIKGLITNRVDSYREPYGTKVRPYPRQCVFAGTTNADQWNPDSTGGRRFWPIRCGEINRDYLTEQREQLFAEAVRMYRSGATWYDIPAEAAAIEQESRREADVWEDLIINYCASRMIGHVTVGDILQNCLDIKPGDWSQSDQNRVARTLRVNGYIRFNTTRNGKREWAYRVSKAVTKAQQGEADDSVF